MITCYIDYTIDPYKVSEFEDYAKRWIPLVENSEGSIMAIFCPRKEPTIKPTLFSFASLAAYEEYRTRSRQDKDCIAAFQLAEDTKCVISVQRSFMRPVFKNTE